MAMYAVHLEQSELQYQLYLISFGEATDNPKAPQNLKKHYGAAIFGGEEQWTLIFIQKPKQLLYSYVETQPPPYV